MNRKLFVFLYSKKRRKTKQGARVKRAILITNNRDVNPVMGKVEIEIMYVDTYDIQTIFEHVRDMVHEGHRILTHPLSGSVKPFETPFKSILITKERSSLDLDSLGIIESAIVMAKNFSANHKLQHYSEELLEDLRIIDNSIISSGIESFMQ